MAPSVPSNGATRYHRLVIGLAVWFPALVAAACSAGDAPPEVLSASTLLDGRESSAEPTIAAKPEPQTASTSEAAQGDDAERRADGATAGSPPDWLGRRTLPTTPDGAVVPQTTPEELRPRRIATTDRLPPPTDGRFQGAVVPVEPTVLARSTWQEGCPVEPEDLSHLTLSFWGFDGLPHSGEMIVHREVADDIVAVFAQLFAAGFPIEEMRITTRADLDAEPTGDGNNTSAFVCRPVTGGTSFSEHAYGLAIDINPFHNPYQRNDLVLPELAGHYLDRDLGQPGMITAGDVAVEAFAAIGWAWGGNWNSLKDYQHFSRSGR